MVTVLYFLTGFLRRPFLLKALSSMTSEFFCFVISTFVKIFSIVFNMVTFSIYLIFLLYLLSREKPSENPFGFLHQLSSVTYHSGSRNILCYFSDMFTGYCAFCSLAGFMFQIAKCILLFQCFAKVVQVILVLKYCSLSKMFFVVLIYRRMM